MIWQDKEALLSGCRAVCCFTYEIVMDAEMNGDL
jgi:hypothetical protein